jgi:aspartyl protease family protein
MQISADAAWIQIAAYAVAAAVLLTILFSIPRIGPIFRRLFSVGLLALGIYLLLQQAPYTPGLAQIAAHLGLDRQEVVGGEVRIRMSPDGHFWGPVEINGVRRRMLIDSGATVTALSGQTAALVGVRRDAAPVPAFIRTANGVVAAEMGTIERLTLGAIEARDLKVVTSPGLPIDILGMNFLSQLGSWRVEDRTLVLSPDSDEPRPALDKPMQNHPPGSRDAVPISGSPR